jgi:hypothetical protein
MKDLKILKKDELIAKCTELGLDTTGTKDVLIERLEAVLPKEEEVVAEEQAEKPAKKKKVRVFNPMLHRFEYK